MSLPIALQLWSVQMGQDADIFATLEKTAAIGYDGVEFAGYFGKTAAELKAKLTELNLQCVSSHVPCDDIVNKSDEVIAFAQELGIKYIVGPYATFEDLTKWLELINQLGAVKEKYEAAGLQLLFHNHHEEFKKINDRYIMDLMMENISGGEFDTYWIEFAGMSAIDYLKQYAGRVPLVHIKDMAACRTQSTEVGNGVLDIAGIVVQAKASGAEWLVLEQEAFTRDRFESVEIGFNNLKKINGN